MTMRILVINQYFHPDVSSTSQILGELCEDLAHHHDVTVVAGRPSYNPAERLTVRGFFSEDYVGRVRVIRAWSTAFPRRTMVGRLANYVTYLASSLMAAARVDRPDVIVTMTDPPVVAAVAATISRMRHVPFVYITQDVYPQVGTILGHLRPGMTASALLRLNRFLRSSATTVVAIGRDMAQRLQDDGCPPEKIEVIPNWADGLAIRPLQDRASAKESFGWRDRFVVMHSGNVGLSQNLDVLIEAADQLQLDSQVLVVIIGEGASKARLQEEAKRRRLMNVSFLPYQPKAGLQQSLGAADVHLVSLARGLRGYIVPSKIYGIMAAGRPVIAAVEHGSEVARLVEEYQCGTVIEPGDPEALADAIRKSFTQPLEEMGQRGRLAFELKYDRPVATSKYRRLLEEVAKIHLGGDAAMMSGPADR